MTQREAPAVTEAAAATDLLAQTFAHVAEGISIFDAGYRLVAVNARALALSGVTAQDARLGMHLRDILALQAALGEFGPCGDPQAEAERRIAQLRADPWLTYERTRPDGTVVEVRRSPLPGGGIMTFYLDVTERWRARAELAAFQFVVASMADMVSVIDLQGRYLLVNAHWCGVTGVPAEQAAGRLWQQVLPGADTPERREALARCLATRQVQVEQTREDRPGMGWRDMETTYQPYIDAAQTLAGVLLVERDVTERRAEVKRAVDAERFAVAIADNMPGMVGYWTRELRCGFANKQYLSWFGRDAAQMQGLSMQELMGPELFAKNEPYIRGVLAGENQRFERTLVKPGGEVGHTLAQYIADKRDGVVRGFYVLVSDVTPLKQTQLELERVNAALRISATAFETQEGILVAGADRLVLQVNSAFTRITGYHAADLLGMRALQLRSARHEEAFYDAIADAVRERGYWQGELWVRHAAGNDFPVSMTVTAVADPAGRITHYVVTYVDITDRQRREEQRRADEAAQRAALVREVHHRIKNNLQGVMGLLEQHAQRQLGGPQALAQVISQVKSIAVLHGLQGKAGDGLLLHDLAAAVTEQVRALWKVPVEFAVHGTGALAIVEEEGVPLALIINEMLHNAVKHADPRWPGLQVSLEQRTAQAQACLRVRNRGRYDPAANDDPLAGAGRQLMANLMPSAGASLEVSEAHSWVEARLELGPPVLVPWQHDATTTAT